MVSTGESKASKKDKQEEVKGSQDEVKSNSDAVARVITFYLMTKKNLLSTF